MFEPIGIYEWEHRLVELATRYHGLKSLSNIEQMTLEERYSYYTHLQRKYDQESA